MHLVIVRAGIKTHHQLSVSVIIAAERSCLPCSTEIASVGSYTVKADWKHVGFEKPPMLSVFQTHKELIPNTIVWICARARPREITVNGYCKHA